MRKVKIKCPHCGKVFEDYEVMQFASPCPNCGAHGMPYKGGVRKVIIIGIIIAAAFLTYWLFFR